MIVSFVNEQIGCCLQGFHDIFTAINWIHFRLESEGQMGSEYYGLDISPFATRVGIIMRAFFACNALPECIFMNSINESRSALSQLIPGCLKSLPDCDLDVVPKGKYVYYWRMFQRITNTFTQPDSQSFKFMIPRWFHVEGQDEYGVRLEDIVPGGHRYSNQTELLLGMDATAGMHYIYIRGVE